MTNLFELYAWLFNVFAFALLVLVCISLFIVALYCAREFLRAGARARRPIRMAHVSR